MNENIVKKRTFDEIIDELEFLIEASRDVLKEFADKKDIINSLKKIESLKLELAEFKKIFDDYKNLRNDVELYLKYANKIAMGMKEEAESMKKHHNLITTILQEETDKVNSLIKKEYRKTIDRINTYLENNAVEITEKIKDLHAEVKRIYNAEYLEDIRKIGIRQFFTNILLIFLLAALSFFAFKFNKKITFVQNVAYANYQLLHSQQ